MTVVLRDPGAETTLLRGDGFMKCDDAIASYINNLVNIVSLLALVFGFGLRTFSAAAGVSWTCPHGE